MKERFFLDGVGVHGTGVAVGQAVELSVQVDSGAADTAIARCQDAAVGTDTADHLLTVHFFIQKPFVGPLPELFGRTTFKDLAANVTGGGSLAESERPAYWGGQAGG